MIEIDQKEYEEIMLEISKNRELPFLLHEKFIYLKDILERLTKQLTSDETLQFPSLFSRITYISRKYNLPKKLEWELQNIRVFVSVLIKNPEIQVTDIEYNQAEKSILHLVEFLFKYIEENNTSQLNDDKSDTKSNRSLKVDNTTSYKRILITSIDRNNHIIEAVSSDNEPDILKIRYNVPLINDIFNDTIDHIWTNAQLNIIDYKIDSEGFYIPKIFILEPDYLIDASALSECFQTYGHSHLHYYRRKFEQISNSQHILLGNLANYFLDELIYAEDIEKLGFNDSFIKAFKQKPFEFTSCQDISQISDFKDFMTKAQKQFNNIKRVIGSDFESNHIDINSCTLEPSFFCEKYGLQGRLDLLEIDYEKRNNLKIIELKSGSLPYPKTDATKVSINHEVQTTIYRLIIESVFNLTNDSNISAAIMYSAAENAGQNLRYAPPYQKLEKEILNIRNQIIIVEQSLYSSGHNAAKILLQEICNIDNYGKAPQYLVKQIELFDKNLSSLSDLEKSYLYHFIAFISRELYIHKIGNNNYDSYRSTACLWNTEFAERQESFDLISDLEIIEINDSGRDLHILFKRRNTTDFVNFREGELCILYPHQSVDDTVLNNQIMKGSISKITKEQISLRFRYKQKNKKYFDIHKFWAIEHDHVDHAYNNMYTGLFEFFKSSKNKRDLILGIAKPEIEESIEIEIDNENKTIQKLIIENAIKAKNYYLIVGPPGTGKTSIYAKELIKYYYTKTESDILLIGYTNRAVDELCETIQRALAIDNQDFDEYIRIGTELSCDPKYRYRLLQFISNSVKNRTELRQIIQKSRIIIGTLASITGKPEIFELKHFNIAIIDEASQILEPQIVGILPKIDKFVMIGDHKQLSTISLQNEKLSKINDEQLDIIKLYDCRESLFERLYRINEENNWTHSYGTLIYQGRMHTDISSFPNKYFYDNKLLPALKWQTESIGFKSCESKNKLTEICIKNRIYFFDVAKLKDDLNNKINTKEADLVVDLCKTLINIFRENNINFDPTKTLGIITPYRNQIALIRHKLQETNIVEFQNIMIDTVERFQGSQRDIIIFSCCINKLYQLETLSNLNKDANVDRKLNVALTRARKQLFILGNKQLLSYNSLYYKLINFIFSKD